MYLFLFARAVNRTRFSFFSFLFLVSFFLSFFLIDLNKVLAIKIILGLPCVVFIAVSFPFQKVFDFPISTNTFVNLGWRYLLIKSTCFLSHFISVLISNFFSNLFVTSKIEFSNSRILKVAYKPKSILKPIFNGKLVLIHYLKNNLSLFFFCFFLKKTFCSTLNW